MRYTECVSGVGWDGGGGRAREGQNGEGKRERGRQTMVALTLNTILSGFRSYAEPDLFSPKKERRGRKEEACLCKITQLSTAQPSLRQKTSP